jgi:hypothetical protein
MGTEITTEPNGLEKQSIPLLPLRDVVVFPFKVMAGTEMDMVGNVLPQIFDQGATEDKGELARLQSFVGAIAVADLVKTTLGPKGMDKIL